MAKRLIAFLIFFPAFFFISSPVFAAIPDKFVVIVNPVREKILWRNRESVERQIKIMEENNVPSTWLLQYSVVKDRQTVELFDNLNSSYEIGVLLEVNEELANESFVPYLYGRGDWARADKVLLSGYKPDERKRMIDVLFEQFRLVFGRYPESVGAWYIDTDSLNYIVNKYRIKSVMDVADQYQTDSYGVWGQPWGTPYYPSRYNSILPASSLEDQLDVVTIQWAVRDPVLGYGLTVYDSTYSVQANDYINHHGFDTNYFGNLVKSYLNSSSVLSQLTIGLEAGQEGAVFLDELEKQINWIKETERESTFVTMSEFASFFKATYRDGNPAFFVTGVDPYNKNNTAYWFSSPYYRAFFFKEGSRFSLDDLRIYDGVGIFYDSIEEDEKDRLLREIPACIDSAKLKDNKLI
ncbi:hypothetical protein HY612_04140, partial [Candidatus Roizmanbacteria bacterium]|nr:hypothetical protein [Candidatus Roizmanbacteria bacterium]